MAKKKTKKTTKKKAPAKKARGAKKPREQKTEIVFSYAEIDFLRKITGKGRGKNNYQVFVVIHLLQG